MTLVAFSGETAKLLKMAVLAAFWRKELVAGLDTAADCAVIGLLTGCEEFALEALFSFIPAMECCFR